MPLKFALTGSSGLIGSAVFDWLTARGHSVTRFVRPSLFSKNLSDCSVWNPRRRQIDLEALEGHDAVIHLAGAGISAQRWTARYKNIILESRVESTRFLADSLRRLKRPPKFLFSASAIGYYGNHSPMDIVDETGHYGRGFLTEVTREWEMATRPAEAFGIRVTHMRFGLVLDRHAGALAKILPLYYCGLGGPIGLGKQMMSWIALEEIPQIIYFLTINGGAKGPVNFTSPNPVSNREFSAILGSVLRRPSFLPLPSLAVRVFWGEMGKELLLNGAYVIPRRLLDKGYSFMYPDLRTALQVILK